MSKPFHVILSNADDNEISDLFLVSGPGNEDVFKPAWYEAVEDVKKANPEEWYFSDAIQILRTKPKPWTIKSVPFTEVAS